MPAPTAHAKFGASNAKRRMNCPGSLHAEAPFPDESSPYAELGTAAHELGEFCLINGHEDAFAFIGDAIPDLAIVACGDVAVNASLFIFKW